jgi:hypothetical protein
MHDASKVLLGNVGSSDRVISVHDADPASFPAGRVVRGKSDGKLSLASSDGALIGVSVGKSLSDTLKTAVCRAGNWVPLALGYYKAVAQLTFISKRPDLAVTITLTTGGTAGSEVVTVVGPAVSVQIQSATSTTTQIKAAIDGDAAAAALMEVQIASGQGSTAVSAFSVAALDAIAQPVVGAAVRASDTTGLGILAGGTLTGAVYLSGLKTGIDEAGNSVPCALIDMGGGL